MANPSKQKKARKTYSKDEKGRAERFRDFANVRVNRALKAVDAVAKLSNKRSYGYTDTHVKNILAALENAHKKVAAAFSGGSADSTFKVE